MADWLTSAFQSVIDKLNSFFQWILDLFVEIFESIWFLLQDLFCWLYDALLGVVVSMVVSLDMGTVSSWSGYWAMVPADVWNIMGLIGLGPALGIIGTAIVIRLALQLIPFVRLGN